MKSGIYKIINIITSDFYIGSAKDLNKRKSNHFNNLKNKQHINKHLQNAVNKYGIENFKFEVLSKCPVEYNIKLEQWFIDNTKPEHNICKIAGSVLGRIHKQSTKDKISVSNMGRIISIESRIKISKTLTGRKNGPPSEETKRKISESQKWRTCPNIEQAKIYLERARLKIIKAIDHIDNNGNIIKYYVSAADAGRDLNIDPKRISMCVIGSRKHYKGMKFQYSKYDLVNKKD